MTLKTKLMRRSELSELERDLNSFLEQSGITREQIIKIQYTTVQAYYSIYNSVMILYDNND